MATTKSKSKAKSKATSGAKPKAKPKLLEIRLSELQKYKLPPEVAKLVKRDALNGKGFAECHRTIRAQSGIWIPELDPIFKRLDKMLGLPQA